MAKRTRTRCITTATAALLLGCVQAAFGHEVSLSCPAAFGPIPHASGLIAYYPLDGNTADVSGNGLDAIEVNAVTPAPGKVGQGYYFNGKDSFIRVAGDITPTVYPQITITAWIKPEAVDGARYIVNQGTHGNRSLFVWNGTVSAGRAVIGDSRHTVFADRWVFVALTYDHDTNTAVLLSDVTISAVEATTPEQPRPSILLGAKAPGNSGFAGVIDEVRIYNRALTTTELAGLNRAGNDAVAYPQTDVFVRTGTNNALALGDDAQLIGSAPHLVSNPGTMDIASAVTEGQGTQQLSDYGRITMSDPGPTYIAGDDPGSDASGAVAPTAITEWRLDPAQPSQVAEDQLGGIDAAATTKPIDKVGPTPGESGSVAPLAVTKPVDKTEPLPIGQSTDQPGQPMFDENPQPDNPTQLPGDQFEPVSAEDIPTGPEYQVADQNVEYVAEGTMLMPELSDGGPSGGTGTTQQPRPLATVLAYAPGEAQLTEISGKRGSIVQVHMDVQRTVNRNHPYRVGTNDWEVWEMNDKLCEIRTAFAVVRECGEDGDGNPGSYKQARFNLDTSRVTALQVCTRKSNGRVKGIRIRGVGLSRAAPSGLDNVSEQAELAYSNCNGNWNALVMCPGGQVAAGLKAHFDPGKGTSKKIPALVGLQLYCRALTEVRAS